MKRINSVLTKIVIKMKQHTYNNRLKYLYLDGDKNSDRLIVVFSGFGGKKKSVYNYVATLSDCKDKRLFILDDFGWEGRGSYYLFENGNRYVEDLVTALITDIMNREHVHSLITVGSSKGGSAAIYYGLKLDADKVIAGAPQYYIGDYLNIDKHILILEGMMGETTGESVDILNSVLSNMITEKGGGSKTKIFLHYSRGEHTYPEHIQFLLEKLEEYGYDVERDEKNYKNHSEVALYFPQYIKRNL